MSPETNFILEFGWGSGWRPILDSAPGRGTNCGQNFDWLPLNVISSEAAFGDDRSRKMRASLQPHCGQQERKVKRTFQIPAQQRKRLSGYKTSMDALETLSRWNLLPRHERFATVVRMSKRFYLTTAIDYVNGEPHLGHAYEKIIADVIVRARRSLGQQTFFLTGLDEHGQKVQQAAAAEGKNAREYCDQLAIVWKSFAQKLDLINDDFVRTTEPRHQKVVQTILSRLNQAGHFYQKEYEGIYSTRAETFLTDKDRKDDGTFDAVYGEVVRLKERNYYFRLQPHQQWLIDYLEQNPSFVQPDSRRKEVLGFLKHDELEDLCITRPVARLNWGIPFPLDTSYVTYVWFDALVNYISVPAAHGDAQVLEALGSPKTSDTPLSLWPADIHVVGKDIVKFNAVYWPIMLKAMGLPLPKQILAHGWWQKDGEKMSKHTGNVVDPVAVIEEWGVDAFRFYVVRELDLGADGNWTDAGFRDRYNAELADGLGNLVNRSLSMLRRYRNGLIPGRSNALAPETERAVNDTK